MLKRKPKTKTQLMREQAEEVMERLSPHVEVARKEAKLRAAEAREKAAPYVHDVKERTAPAVEGAKAEFTTKVLPVITAAVAAASEATEEAREEARKRGTATAAALKGEVEAPRKKESHKLRNLLLLMGLGGLVAFVAKKMSDRDASTAWQSSYTPSSTGSSTGTTPTYSAPGVSAAGAAEVDDTPMGTAAAAAAAQARDEAGAGPDEAAADAAEAPHTATTPDDPAEEIKVDDDKS